MTTRGVLSSFLDAAPVGVVVYDHDLRIVRINRKVEAMGRVRPEHLGQRITDAFPDVAPGVLDSLRRVFETGDAVANQPLTRPDGHAFLLSFFPVHDHHNSVSHVGCLFSDVEELAQAELVISAQRTTIQELSTPILALADGLLIAPLVGIVDGERALLLTERLLHAIAKHRSRAVVIDVTGVPVVGGLVANHLSQTAQAARLMGADTIISGLSAETALALAGIDVDLDGFTSVASLADAVTELAAHNAGHARTPPADRHHAETVARR
jgi:rsbT co-antagonist protein RsbR